MLRRLERLRYEMKLCFKPEDFEGDWKLEIKFAGLGDALEKNIRFQVARIANTRLAEMLKDAPVVFSEEGSFEQWWDSADTFDNASHRALLVNIEEIMEK